MATASESVAAFESVDRTVSVSEPLKFRLPWYERLASAALICACVPDRVRVAELFAPELMVAPPGGEMLGVRWVPASLVVGGLPSTWWTETPAMEGEVPLLTFCAPG